MLANQLVNNLRPLCYEHHTEMKPVPIVSGNGNGTKPAQELKYACEQSGCPVRFTSTEGYFVAPHETGQAEKEILPLVRCPHDEAPMYLGEIRPEERSFRLWRCPLCSTTSTNNHALATAG